MTLHYGISQIERNPECEYLVKEKIQDENISYKIQTIESVFKTLIRLVDATNSKSKVRIKKDLYQSKPNEEKTRTKKHRRLSASFDSCGGFLG